MAYNKRVQTNNASTSKLNGRTGIQLKNYMKASSSSSVDAEFLPFKDAELLPLDDAELLPFEDAVLLPWTMQNSCSLTMQNPEAAA